VGQRARRDNRHRVLEEGAFHLLLELDRLDVAVVDGLLNAVVSHAFPCSRGTDARSRSDAYTSRKRTSFAFFWMKPFRASTSSPISVENTSSAIAASSTDTRNS